MSESKNEIEKFLEENCGDCAKESGWCIQIIANRLKDKFYIIPKTESPKKWIEVYFQANRKKITVSKKWGLKLKWREDKID